VAEKASATPTDRRPNILLISLDALRADHLGSYGYDRDTSPFLDQLAAGGLRFGWSFVNTHGTPPSHTTLFSSLYQETHRVSYRPKLGDWSPHQVPETFPFLPQLLGQAGYATLGVTDGGFMSASFGFDRGFDHFDDGAEGIASGTERLLSMLRKPRQQPIFAFLHTYEIHSPYHPPEQYRELFGTFDSQLAADSETLHALQDDASSLSQEDLRYLRAMYDASIRYTDDQLRAFFAELREQGFLDNALVIITADHGEEFGDHGGLLHRDSLYEELLRVPLIIFGPGMAPGSVDDRLVSTIDIAPTLLLAAESQPHPLMAGQDLLASERRKIDFPHVFSQYSDRRLSIRTRRWKLIESPREDRLELYDLLADPDEKVNLATKERRLAGRLRKQLRLWKEGCPRLEDLLEKKDSLAEEEQEKLRALGYLG
jgi:arylsulfatase A-like enzyme